MSEQALKTALWFLKPGEDLFFPAADYSSGYLMRVIEMVRAESGFRFSSTTTPAGTRIYRA